MSRLPVHTGALLSGKSATYHGPNREGGEGSASPDRSHLQKGEKGMWEGKMSSKAPFVGSPLTSGEGKAEPLKHSTGRTGDRGADAQSCSSSNEGERNEFGGFKPCSPLSQGEGGVPNAFLLC